MNASKDNCVYTKSSQATEALLASIQSIIDHYEKSETSTEGERTSPSQILQKSVGHILTLKQSQRSLGLKLGSDLSQELDGKRREVENQALLLQNLLYEKNHLIKEIRSCKRFECPNLLKMSKDELEIIDETDPNIDTNTNTNTKGASASASANTSTSNDDDEAADKIIDRFLAPPSKSGKQTNNANNKKTNYSHRDTARHSYNLSKMHSELTTRGTLHSKLLKAKKTKSALLEDLSKKRKFLNSIPNQIHQLEKSVEGLRGYFESNEETMNMNVNTSQDFGMVERSEKAKELSAPLYILFVQFGTFIQAHSSKNADTDIDTDTDTDTDTDGELNCQDWKVKVVSSDDGEGNSAGTGNVYNVIDDSVDAGTQELIRKFLRKEEKALQLQIPITASSKDVVTIQFEYLNELKIVTAHLVQDKSLDSLWLGRQSLLLMNLFDGDTGKDLPIGCSSEIVYRDDDDDDDDDSNGTSTSTGEKMSATDTDMDLDQENDNEQAQANEKEGNDNESVSSKQMALWKIRQSFNNDTKMGKPYVWLQYIAGLNYPKPQPGQDHELLKNSQIEASVKTVIHALYRRIRSHATLFTLTKKLKNRPTPVPSHPSLCIEDDSPGDILAKLISFEEENVASPGSDNKVYCAKIKRKQKSIEVRVKIDARYPAVPPTWSLQSFSIGSNPTQVESTVQNKRSKTLGIRSTSGTVEGVGDDQSHYDSTLGMIESRVNSLEDSSLYFNDKIEETFDWILMHQLRWIIMEWDLYNKTLEEEAAGTSANRGSGGRSRRGRERYPATLFELYKRGL